MARDPIWAGISDVAESLNSSIVSSTLAVRSERRRSFLGWSVTEGIVVFDNWTDVFEPVRRRRILGKDWAVVQPLDEAASNVQAFLHERPDLQ